MLIHMVLCKRIYKGYEKIRQQVYAHIYGNFKENSLRL